MHLASGFDPDSQLITSRRNLSARLAAWAALGFLMLLPLIGYANWRGIKNIELTFPDENIDFHLKVMYNY